jgi:hypothetical protein
MSPSNPQLTAKSIYDEAYRAYEDHNKDKLIELCRLLYSNFPDSKEAKWATQNFKLAAEDLGTGVSLPRQWSSGSITALKSLAWLSVAVGVLGAIVLFTQFGESLSGLIGGLAVLLQGILVCSLFHVIASMAENLIATEPVYEK